VASGQWAVVSRHLAFSTWHLAPELCGVWGVAITGAGQMLIAKCQFPFCVESAVKEVHG